MREVVSINPFRCRVWALHDRIEEHITELSCKGVIESFLGHGQRHPVLGRRLVKDPDFDVELIYGARRLFAARHINRSLMVELCDLSDRDAIVAMDIENRQRKDISPYERGMSYARWLRTGHFANQEDIAAGLKISSSQVSRLLKLARLPSVVVGAFRGAGDICEGWGIELSDALEDPGRRPSIIHAARKIGDALPRPSAREVYQRLMSASIQGRKPKVMVHDKVVCDSHGNSLFRIQHRRNAVAMVLPIERTSPKLLSAIEKAVVNVIEGMENHTDRLEHSTAMTNAA